MKYYETMGKGLSNIQRSILKIIAGLPEGSEEYYVYDNVKASLYPELYVMRYEFDSSEQGRGASIAATAKMFGVSKTTIWRDRKKGEEQKLDLRSTNRSIRYYGDSEKKNAARVTISRSISRLVRRELLHREKDCIVITDKGRLTVNDVPK